MMLRSLAALLVLAAPLSAETAPYAGRDADAVAALPPERVEGLRAGAGLGYALPAELNGLPGPLHVLELAPELDLTADQRDAAGAIRRAMLRRAVPLGERVIAAETALDAAFADPALTAARVAELTAEAGAAEAALRAAHLAAHLEMAPLLTRHQRALYARLRGYAGADGAHGGH